MAEIAASDSETPGLGRRLKLPKSAWRLLAILLVLALAAAGIFAYVNQKNNGKYNYRYKDVAGVTIKLLSAPSHSPPLQNLPAIPDATVSLRKPPELLLVNNAVKSDSGQYRHQYKNKTVASINILMYTFGGNYGKIVEPIIASSLKESPQTKDYQSATNPLNAYVRDNIPNFDTKNYSIILGSSQNLTTSHIKGSAWEFDVTASKKTNPQPYQKWHGKLLYIWTSSHLYYILLDSIQQNWQPNMSTWQQIIDSLQLN